MSWSVSKKWIGFLTVLAIVAGCGKGGVPVIATPTDGQVIPQGQQIVVTLQDNDYDGVSIVFRGAENLRQYNMVCQNSTNAPAYCYSQGYGSTGGSFGACGSSGCTLVIIAQRGDFKDVRTVQVGGTVTGATPNPTYPQR